MTHQVMSLTGQLVAWRHSVTFLDRFSSLGTLAEQVLKKYVVPGTTT